MKKVTIEMTETERKEVLNMANEYLEQNIKVKEALLVKSGTVFDGFSFHIVPHEKCSINFTLGKLRREVKEIISLLIGELEVEDDNENYANITVADLKSKLEAGHSKCCAIKSRIKEGWDIASDKEPEGLARNLIFKVSLPSRIEEIKEILNFLGVRKETLKAFTLQDLKHLLKKEDDQFPTVTIDSDNDYLKRITTVYIDDKFSFNFTESMQPNGLTNIDITLYDVDKDKEYDIKDLLKEYSRTQYYLLVGILTGGDEEREKELKAQVFGLYLILSGEEAENEN